MANLPEEVLTTLAKKDIANAVTQSLCKIVESKELCESPSDCEGCLLAVDGLNISIEGQTPKKVSSNLRKVLSLIYFNPEFDAEEIIAEEKEKQEQEEQTNV